MKKIALIILVCMGFCGRAAADEGMWLLPMLQKLNINDMKAKGLRLSAEDIYNANGTSLKDAIVIFGGGCTGEIVSPDGLLFTNHHCGYGNIQSLSSVENDYLKNGFWAMSRTEEIPAPGLAVRFIRQIIDVTDEVLEGVTETTPESDREQAVKDNTAKIEERLGEEYPGMNILVETFFGGNQYIAFAIEVYSDVRLVGTPPTSIGKFGGDTDNWMWPRHTGDFSIFRVYSDSEGRPAAYSPDNVPYKSPAHLKISLKGYSEGDFAMIMGFPGSTDRFMTSYEIDEVLETANPNRIYVRGIRQDILRGYMQSSDEVRIKYAAKYAQSSNYWKNSIGMSRGLRKLDVKAQKEATENAFRTWVNSGNRKEVYGNSLDLIDNAVADRKPYLESTQYLAEALLRGTELISASTLSKFIEENPEMTEDLTERFFRGVDRFYKDYDANVDREVAKAMFRIIDERLPDDKMPPVFVEELHGTFNGDVDRYVDYIYDNTIFVSGEKVKEYVERGDFSDLENDPAVKLMNSVYDTYRAEYAKMAEINSRFREGHRKYVAGLQEMNRDEVYYPDANFTIRLTYGNILPYSPADAVEYNYYTTLSGVIAKEDATNPTEFTVPDRLKDLYYAKDFGQYESNGNVNVGFISNNDITGGNSGSPVLNGDGELIGLAFDGNWEAMSGDIAFEPELQRCINVDVRYVLFVVDKFAGAGYLLDEMTIVR